MRSRNTAILVALFALLMDHVFLVETEGEPATEEGRAKEVLSLEAETTQLLELRGEESAYA